MSFRHTKLSFTSEIHYACLQHTYLVTKLCLTLATPWTAACQLSCLSLSPRWKEDSEKATLKLNIQNTKIMKSSPITSWQIDGENSDSCSLSWWCYPTISSSVVPFFSCLQSFPASGFCPVSQFFASGGQSTGASASASASVLPVIIQDWFPLGLTDLKSLLSKRLSRVFKSINSLVLNFLYGPTLTSVHDYWINHSFD